MNDPFKEQKIEEHQIINRELSVEEIIEQASREIKKKCHTQRAQNIVSSILLPDDMKRRMKVIERINKKRGMQIIQK